MASKASYGFAECSAFVCPREPNERGSFSILKSQMYQDRLGHYWCNLCTRHYELMNWAYEHRWPAVRVQGKMRYAIYNDAGEWSTSIMGASQDMIDALYETLIEQKRAPIEPDAHKDAVERVNAFIDAIEEETA